MKKCFLLILLFLATLRTQAQTFTELSDSKPRDDAAAWNKLKNTFNVTWGNTDTRYTKYTIPGKNGAENPDGGDKDLHLTAWRGERVNAQALIYVKSRWDTVSYTHLTLPTKRIV